MRLEFGPRGWLWGLKAGIWPLDLGLGTEMGLGAGIWNLRLGSRPGGCDFGFEARIWTLRLGVGLGSGV